MSMDKIESLVSEFETLKKEFQAKAQVTFKDAFKEFWEKHPNIKAVVWCQYTPYFNDGDPCVFGVHDMWPLTENGEKYWKEEGGSAYAGEDFTPLGWKGKELQEAYVGEITLEEAQSARKALETIQKLPSEVFELIFGDHVMITATHKGFEVEEHEHD